jgi:hypothetical protein
MATAFETKQQEPSSGLTNGEWGREETVDDESMERHLGVLEKELSSAQRELPSGFRTSTLERALLVIIAKALVFLCYVAWKAYGKLAQDHQQRAAAIQPHLDGAEPTPRDGSQAHMATASQERDADG